ncbi:MAG: family 1 glycosylhydrolase [Candidatus Omnitrophota bacterium]
MIEFPKDFFFGAATSAYQVEGNNFNSDWWEWERRVRLKEPSASACRHYEFYKQDFDLAKSLNHNAHRLSIEWSRVEPEEGVFSEREISHYRDVIVSLRERNIEPIVTLHHFTSPIWFAQKGGWKNKNNIIYFLRFVSAITQALSDHVKYWVTINEPMVYIYHAYILGAWPPQEKSLLSAVRVKRNLISAHIGAYRKIHQLYKARGLASPSVSIAKNLQDFTPCRKNLRNKVAVFLRNKSFNFSLLDTLSHRRSLDFIGINYYTHSIVDAANWGIRSLLVDVCKEEHGELKKNSLGWDIYPQGLYKLLLKLKKYKKPVFILENGICTEDDELRWGFISSHLAEVYRAMAKGVKVMGYIYWSLLDNFEWDKGFGARFGLIEVDYSTYKRTVRESAKKFAVVARDAKLE